MNSDPEQLFAEAVEAHRKGDFALALRRLENLRRAFPDHPDVLHLLGVVRLGQGRDRDALEPLGQAARIAERAGHTDRLASILNALGSAERRAGAAASAAETLARAARLAPSDADVHFNLGNALWDAGRVADAAASFARAAELAPKDAGIHFSLGEALARAGNGRAAEHAYAEAIALDPGHAKAQTALAAFRLEANDLAGARRALERALALDPALAEAHLNLGLLRVLEGNADLGIAATRRAVELKPSLSFAHSNLVQQMHYSARHSAAEILAEARRWNAAHARAPQEPTSSFPRPSTGAPHPERAEGAVEGEARRSGRGRESSLSVDPGSALRAVRGDGVEINGPFPNARDPGKCLKVGYVGGDFRSHPVGFFTLALFAHHDPAQIETFVYMTDTRTDAVSEKIRAFVAHWRDVASLDDAELADRMRADGVDILVDMAGHTAKNRLGALAMRAAPVQAVGGGVIGTTGVEALDYFLADRFEIPPGFERFYSEAVVRLPFDYICYAPPEDAPPVAPLPARANGIVTFGCFNAAAKVTPEAIALWARVLAAVPDSRLFLKSFAYADPESRARFLRLFAEAGVPEARLAFEGPSAHAELLAAYGRVDIALDPVPYSGGLTTLESLWMGVPVVALPSETFASRHSASHLANAGLPELVAKDADDYVAIARRLASDPPGLEKLRRELRAKLAASPVCDGRAYARGIEAAYREMWRRWCAEEKPSALDIPPA